MIRSLAAATALAFLATAAQAQFGAVGTYIPYTVNNPGIATDNGLDNNARRNADGSSNVYDAPNASTGGPCYGVWGGCGSERTQRHGR